MTATAPHPPGLSLGVHIRAVTTIQDEMAWNRYVQDHPAATFFHWIQWRGVLARAFGHVGHYLLATRGEQLVGVLPLAEIRSRLFGNALISTPFCVYGGVLADDPASAMALEEAACGLAADLGVDYLELRDRHPVTPASAAGAMIPGEPIYHTFRRPLGVDPAANLLAIPRKQRAEVRQGVQRGLAITFDQDPDRFYDLYSESLRNLGTPVFSRRYLRILLETFPDGCEILLVHLGGKPLCGVLSFYFRNQVLPYYGGGGVVARQYSANAFMYWQLMNHAASRGCGQFDFGRSKVGTGSYEFKRLLGFTPEPLFYRYGLLGGGALPGKNPMNPKYQMLIRIWRHLPLVVSQTIGPWVAGSLG